METRKRTIAKALSWRLLATTVTAVIVLIVTDEVRVAATVGILDTFIKLGVYYIHERSWLRIQYGKAAQPEYEI